MHVREGVIPLPNSIIGYFMGSPFPGPTPAYNNPPIEPQFYQPSRFQISNISIGVQTTVTTTVNQNYVIGQLVRLIIPNGYGCTQLTNRTAYVIAIPAANQVTLDLNSKTASAFINAGRATPPQIVAVGDVNTGAINIEPNPEILNIPGSFINISPL